MIDLMFEVYKNGSYKFREKQFSDFFLNILPFPDVYYPYVDYSYTISIPKEYDYMLKWLMIGGDN